MKNYQILSSHIFHVNTSEPVIFFLSPYFLFHFKTHSFAATNIHSQLYYHLKEILFISVHIIHIFVGLLGNFPPIVVSDAIQLSLILYYFGILPSALSMIFTNFFQYFTVGGSFIDSNTNNSVDSANSNGYFSFNKMFPFSPS